MSLPGRFVHDSSPISTNLVLSFVAEHVLGMPRSY